MLETVPLSFYLMLSAMLFCIGLVGVMVRRNVLVVLMSIEIMFNASSLSFVAFAKHHENMDGHLFSFFSIAVAAAEAAVGLAIVIHIFRHFRSTNVDEVTSLKG